LRIRTAVIEDRAAIFALVEQFATSFQPEPAAFDRSFQQLLKDDSAWLGIAVLGDEIAGYCLGFDHVTFYANGRVAWVEEIMVKAALRGEGIGRALMAAFEDWARARGVKLVALATRRAAPFYAALGYEASATYFRKLLETQD
jgi:GNAT superfamily N-acetyltransferase